MAKSPTPVLTCKECGYNNEPERVYCHNCGQKLDRSVLPKDNEVRRETPEQAQRRIRKMTNPGSNPIASGARSLVKTLIWAAVVAGLIQMLREPDGAPAKKNELGANASVTDVLMALAESPQPRAVAISESDLNYGLGKQLKAKDAGIPGVQFDRAYSILTPGEARICLQESIYGFPLHAGVGLKPEIKNGAVEGKLVSGNIGRLPVHPAVMEYVSYAFPFRQLAKAFKREREYLGRLSDVRVEADRVVLVKGGAAAPVAPAAAKPATPAPAAPAAPAPATPPPATTPPAP